MQIMELLGVRHGIVALTKIDLVDEETVQRRQEEIARFLEPTFMAGAPICPVSSETGAGIFEFYDVLVDRIEQAGKTHQGGVFRMPIGRTFAQKGFGVVVTGIPVSGTLRVGDSVELVPGRQTGRVRGIQRFLRDADEGGYGQCLALNIPDMGKTPPERGQALCAPGYLRAGLCFHVRMKTVVNLDPPLRNAEQVKLHTGTTEMPGTLFLLENKTVGPGETALGTIVTSAPVAAAAHDRFIIRRPSPTATVAGGDILIASESAIRPRRKALLDMLDARLAAFDGVEMGTADFRDRQVAYYLDAERPVGASVEEIAKGTLLSPAEVVNSLSRLGQSTIVLGADGHYIHGKRYADFMNKSKARLEQAKKAGTLSIAIAEFQKGLDWPAPLWAKIKADLEAQRVVTVRGDKFILEGAVDAMADPDRRLMESIMRLYEETGFGSPRPDELPERLKAPLTKTDRLLTHLCNQGHLIRIGKNVVFSASVMKKAQDIVVQCIREKGVLDSADFKYHIDSTRKYALAILDYFDARKVTVRVGNNRRLAVNYEKNLLK